MLVQEIISTVPDPISGLLGYASSFAAVMALGAIKKYTTLADTSIGKAIKPIQPWIAAGVPILAMLAASKLGLQIDPQQFAAAPVGTVVAIGAAEVLSRLTKRR